MSFYIYHYCDPESGTPFWVGKGKGRRAFCHLNNCKRLCDSSYNTFFYRKLRKMLLSDINPDIKIVRDQLEEKEALDLEMSDIKRIGRRDQGKGPLTNLTDGGEGASGFTHSEEAKQRMSKAHLGKILSKETRQRMSEVHMGKKHTEETKQKIGKIHKGKVISEKTKQRMSKVQKGKVTSEETKQKLRKANLGKVISEETRQKMSENHFRRSVSCSDLMGNFVKQFDSIKTVIEDGFNPTCVSNCLAGRRKTHGGLHWRYSNA